MVKPLLNCGFLGVFETSVGYAMDILGIHERYGELMGVKERNSGLNQALSAGILQNG